MIKNLNKKIENLFEQSENSFSIEEFKKNYSLVEDNHQLENLSYVFSSVVTKKDIAIFFTQLSSFFEMGFLFEKTHFNHSRAVQMFIYSHPLTELHGLQSLTLPQAELYKVLSTNSRAYLMTLNLTQFDIDQKLQSFYIRISETQSLILMSSLAEPWLQLRIEALQKTLMKIPFE